MDLDNHNLDTPLAADSIVLEDGCDQVLHLSPHSVHGRKLLYATRLWKVPGSLPSVAGLRRIHFALLQVLENNIVHHCSSALRGYCRQALCVWGGHREQALNLSFQLGTLAA